MKEIVERLQEKRQIERARQIVESAGYKVSKVHESYNPNILEELVRWYAPRLQFGGETTASIWDDIVQEYDNEDLANDVIEALENENVYESIKISESTDSKKFARMYAYLEKEADSSDRSLKWLEEIDNEMMKHLPGLSDDVAKDFESIKDEEVKNKLYNKLDSLVGGAFTPVRR